MEFFCQCLNCKQGRKRLSSLLYYHIFTILSELLFTSEKTLLAIFVSSQKPLDLVPVRVGFLFWVLQKTNSVSLDRKGFLISWFSCLNSCLFWLYSAVQIGQYAPRRDGSGPESTVPWFHGDKVRWGMGFYLRKEGLSFSTAFWLCLFFCPSVRACVYVCCVSFRVYIVFVEHQPAVEMFIAVFGLLELSSACVTPSFFFCWICLSRVSRLWLIVRYLFKPVFFFCGACSRFASMCLSCVKVEASLSNKWSFSFCHVWQPLKLSSLSRGMTAV